MNDPKRIVLVHGWGAGAAKLEPLAQELRNLGWTVLVPRLPGFDLPPPAELWGVEEYANYVLNEARNVFSREAFILFGHSFGGRLALKLGAAQPEDLRALVLCSAAGVSQVNPIKRFVFLAFAKAGNLSLRVFPPIARLRPLLYKLARAHDYEQADGIMREVFKKIVAEDLGPAATYITLPSLILWGKQDRMTRLSDAYRIKSAISRSQLIVYEAEGHRLPYNKPREIAAAIETWTHNSFSD